MSKLTRHDYLEAVVHLTIMLIVAVALGLIGWFAGEHGYVLTYWWS